MSNYEDIRKKYVAMLDEKIDSVEPLRSSQYKEFRKQYLSKKLSWYESACNFCEKILAVAPDKKQVPEYERAIAAIHLSITPTGVVSFSLLGPLLIALLALVFFYLLPPILFTGGEPYPFFLGFFLLLALILYFPLNKLPITLAANWRMRAGNQMVLSIFYLVTYMRHTSNLEHAIDFAAQHLGGPLGLDLKKVLWEVETEKYESIRESLDVYLEQWKEYNMEYIESIHLIEGSLVESSEIRRVEMLDKALSVMLDETYEKMLHYAHNLKSPLTTLHMLGVILPILGLVILPLVVTMMEGVYWYHLFMLYNVALPIGVYFLGRSMLAKRPSGYSAVDISVRNPELARAKSVVFSGVSFSPLLLAVFAFLTLFAIGITPLAYGFFNPDTDLAYTVDGTFETIDYRDQGAINDAKFFYYGWWKVKKTINGNLQETGDYFGPFGLGATLLGLFLPLAIGIGIGLYYRLKSSHISRIREETKRLEKEFASALFQLGNRLADGIPVEIAFSKVSSIMEDTPTGKFFDLVSINISKQGMSVEQAIFDEKQGAINLYPSSIIESAMKVLVESSKKGPLIASRAIINISEYIKEMHRVDERLRDLMADVISSMKSQVNFLTPIISGIVIGITSMITKILGTLTNQISSFSSDASGVGGAGIIDIFGAGGIPTYYFQAVVGLYVVQLAYILTVLVNGIENGADKLNEEELLGQSIIKSTLLYVFMSLVIIFIFNMVAGQILTQQY